MNWHLVREVAWREIRTRARTRAFRVITALLVAAAIAGPIMAAVLPDGGDEPREVTVGLVDVDEATQELITQAAAGVLDVSFRDLDGSSPEQVSQAVGDGEVDVALEPGPTLVWDRTPDVEIAAVVRAVLSQQDAFATGLALGLDERELGELLAPAPVQERFADPAGAADGVAQTLASFALLAAFALPQAFGQLALQGVVEEKSTRVVEVLLNHLQPRVLLFGKVLGLTLLAFGQLAIFVAGLTAALLVTDSVHVPAAAWRFLPVVAASIAGGLVIYNTLFALLGSLISRQEDTGQVMLPAIAPAMVGFFIAQEAITGNAASTVAKALTLFPLTAPFLLPVRVARDAIAPWEVALSFGLLALGAWLMIRLAARVYQFTLLHMGARVDWQQLLRLSRGAGRQWDSSRSGEPSPG